MRLGCGERIRTSDLRVMSPTSCRCSTPRLVTLGPEQRSVKRRHAREGWLGFRHEPDHGCRGGPARAPCAQHGRRSRRRDRRLGYRCAVAPTDPSSTAMSTLASRVTPSMRRSRRFEALGYEIAADERPARVVLTSADGKVDLHPIVMLPSGAGVQTGFRWPDVRIPAGQPGSRRRDRRADRAMRDDRAPDDVPSGLRAQGTRST